MTHTYRMPSFLSTRGLPRPKEDRQTRRKLSFEPLRVQLQQLEPRLLLTQGPSQISTYIASSPINISNQSIAYSQNVRGASVRIASGLVPSEDRLLFTNQNNITGTYNSTTGVLTLSGTASGTTYATALNSVKYSNTAANPSNSDRGFSVQLGTAVYNAGTGHYYEYFDFPTTSLDWFAARSDASSRNNLGLTGYLATITASAEQSFISSTFGGLSGWLGARKNALGPNVWSWVTGPEGTQNGGGGVAFYTTSPIAGVYNNWDVANPTGASNQTSVVMQSSGKWASVDPSFAPGGSIIEYGGLGSTPTFTDRWSGTIHVLDRTESPSVTLPSAATLVNATTYTITGITPANSLVQIFVDADNNGVPDNASTPVASQQLAVGITTFSINTPLTQDIANNFLILATGYAGANASLAVDVPTITDNAPPKLTSNIASVSVFEGGSVTNSGAFSDVQGNATVVLSASIGTITQNNAAGTWNWSLNAPDGPSGPTSIFIFANDNFNVGALTTFTYGVNNVVPSISLSGSVTTNEGSPYSLELGVVTDPGTDTITSYSINWGDGIVDVYPGHPTGTSRLHTYSDGPFNRAYGVRVTDEDGTFLAGGLSVQVLNSAPTAVLVSSGPVSYGKAVTVLLSNPHDDSSADTAAGLHYAFATTAANSGGFAGVTYATASTSATQDFTSLAAGTYTVYARIIDKDDGFSEYSTTFTVNKATLTVTADPKTKTYGAADPSLTYTPSGDLFYGDTFAVITGVSLSTATGTAAVAGTHAIGVVAGTAANYEVTGVDGTLTVAKARAAVTINSYSGVYDATAHGLTGSVTGFDAGGAALGGVLSLGANFTDAPGGIANWVFLGGPNYMDESGTAAIDIAKAHASVTVNGYAGTYDAVAHGLAGTATGVNGETLGGLAVGGGRTDAGTSTVAWTFTGGVNYLDDSGTADITIGKAAATVSVNGYSGIYDASPHGTTGVATGVGGVDLSAGLNLGTSFTNAPGGTAHWVFSGGDNYQDNSGDAAIVIDKADAKFVVKPYVGVIYDGVAHTALVTATGVGLAELSAALNLSGTTHTDAGTYFGDVWTFAGGTNYNDGGGTVNDSIAKADAVFFLHGYAATYDGAAHAATGTATGVLGEALAGMSFGGTTHTGAVATHDDTVAFTDATGNYNDASLLVTNAIAKARAAVTINSYSGVYDATAHGLTGSVTGFDAGGAALGGVLSLGANFTDAPGGIANWVFLGGPNYMDESGTAAIDIAKAHASVTVNGYAGTYDAVAHGLAGTATGVNGETLGGLAVGGGRTDAGTSTVAWTFTGGANYLDDSGIQSIVISPRPISVMADSQTKSTGQADPDLTYRISSGSLAGDDGFTGSLTRQPGETAATYAIIQGSLAAGLNYAMSFSGAEFVITAATFSLSGTVFVDFNNDGQVDFGEKGIAGVTVHLTGTDNLGRAVDQVLQTDIDGAYVFRFLQTGNYRVSETQPAGYTQGINTVGTAGGTTSGDVFAVTLAAEATGLNYNFGERPAANGTLQRGQTAGIGFWYNKNGQALIKSLNDGSTSTQLGNWLAVTFPNLYGTTAGTCSLAGKTNAQVATFYQSRFVLKGTKVDAQVLATALSIYVTNATLDNTRVAVNYGFTVTQYGVGATGLFNVGSYGTVFGVANNTTVTVLDLLLAVNSRSLNGVLFKGDTIKRLVADIVFGLINEIGSV